MSSILEQVATFGTDLNTSIPKTYGVVLPYLKANAGVIKSTPRETVSYGPHDRHKADIYTPAESETSENEPIIVFLPGGGLTHGDRLIGGRCEELIYANLGHYFASRGFTTVVIDYRRVGEDKENTKYPAGGEDVGYAIHYLDSKYVQTRGEENLKRPIILFGNSAGGIHVSTYCFSPDVNRPEYENIRVAGAIILSAALDFTNADQSRLPVLQLYFSSTTLEEINAKSAVGNVNALSEQHKATAQLASEKVLDDGVKLFLADCELDPAEITGPKERFIKAHKIARMYRDASEGDGRERNKEEMTVSVIEGHNHVSPCLSLGTGDKEAEKWVEEVVKWIEKVLKD